MKHLFKKAISVSFLTVFFCAYAVHVACAFSGETPSSGSPIIGSEAQAQKQPVVPSENMEKQKQLEQSTLWQGFKSRYSNTWAAKFNETTGIPRFALGDGIDLKYLLKTAPADGNLTAQDVESMTREFITREEVVGIKDARDLKLVKNKFWGPYAKMWYVTYQQTYRGLDVIGAQIRFQILPDGRMISFGSGAHPQVYVNTLALVTAKQVKASIQKKYENTNFRGARIDVKSQPVVYPELKDGNYIYHLAYVVAANSINPPHHYAYYVDAQTGEVITGFSTMEEVTISGNVKADVYNSNFDAYRNYKTRYDNKGQDVQIIGQGNDYTDINGNYSVNVAGTGNYTLRGHLLGERANVYVQSGDPALHERTVPGGSVHDWAWNGAENRISETNVFHHVSKFYDFVKNTMNDDAMDAHSPMDVNVELPDYDNAYYFYNEVTGNEGLVFGAGQYIFRNTAQFPDIIYHEYMHAVSRAVGGGFIGMGMEAMGSQSRGIGEATSDYFSASMTGDPLVGHYAMKDNGQEYMRSLDNNLEYWEDLFPESHTIGQVLSGAFWDLREAVGQPVADALIYQAINSSSLWFSEVLLSILAVDDAPGSGYGGDGNLSNGTPHFREIYEAFAVKHNIIGLKIENSSYAEIPPQHGDNDGVMEGPDEILALNISLENYSWNTPLLGRVTVDEVSIDSQGYVVSGVTLLEGSVLYGEMNPLDIRDGAFRVHLKNVYTLPYDETLSMKIICRVGSTDQQFTITRQIKMPVGRVTNRNIVGEGDFSRGSFGGQEFSYRDGKIVYLDQGCDSNCVGKIYLYDLDHGGTYNLVRTATGDDFLINDARPIAVDGKNIVWSERVDPNSPWIVYIYNLGANGAFGGGDDLGPTALTLAADGGYAPKISGRYISYVRNDQKIGLYDLGADMIKNANDPGRLTIAGATFVGPVSSSVFYNPNTQHGYLVWSDVDPNDPGSNNVYLYDVQRAQKYTLDKGYDPDVSAEWVVWSYSGRIKGYHFGADGQYGTPDDMGRVELTQYNSNSYFFRPRISGNKLIAKDMKTMRLSFFDLKTFKRMQVTQKPYPDFMGADVDGDEVAYVDIDCFNDECNPYTLSILIDRIQYGDSKISTEVIPLWGNPWGTPYNVTQSESWGSIDKPYLCLDQVLNFYGADLTIQPGVQVRFSGTRGTGGIDIHGSLYANGTADNPVVFIKQADEEEGRTSQPVTALSSYYPQHFELSHAVISGLDTGVSLNNYDFFAPPPDTKYAGGRALREVNPFSVKNNIIARCDTALVVQALGSPLIANNTIVNNQYGIFLATPEQCIVKNNIVASNAVYGIAVSGDVAFGGTLSYNNIWGNGINYYTGIGPGAGDISGDPAFKSTAQGNYILACDSVSIDAGDPGDPYGNEPQPNGNRINQGSYGNTSLATRRLDCPSPPPQGGEGSCPYIHVFDGKEYVKDNDVVPAGGGKDERYEYKDYYILSKTPVVEKGNLLLKLVEPLDEISYIDQLQLVAVRHSRDVNVAPDPRGKLYSYKNPVAPASALWNGKENVLDKVRTIEQGDVLGDKGDELVITFDEKQKLAQGARLIMRTDLEDRECAVEYNPGDDECPLGQPNCNSIHVSVKTKKGDWKKVDVLHPHALWDMWAVDLAKTVKQAAVPLTVKLVWTKKHKLDFVGLETSPLEKITVEKLKLVEARHSKDGDVKALLRGSDDKRTRMEKGDEIMLKFSVPERDPKEGQVVSYLLETEGYYTPLELTAKKTDVSLLPVQGEEVCYFSKDNASIK